MLASRTDSLANYRSGFNREGKRHSNDDGMAYDFVEISSITHLSEDRQRIIASFRDIRSGLVEKWSLDITSTTPSLDQIFYALYNADEDCAKKLILYFEELYNLNESDPEIEVEKGALESVLWHISSFTDSLYLVQVKTGYSYDEANNIDISYFPFSIIGLGKQRKIPSRVILENRIWENYYSSFVNSSAMRGSDRYVNISFSVTPEWTEKGLSMRIYARNDCPETNWLITDKKDELAKHYPGCEMKVVMEPGVHYCIDISCTKRLFMILSRPQQGQNTIMPWRSTNKNWT